MGGKINQFTDRAAPDGVRLMAQQVLQQRNGRRTDPLDDLKRRNTQVFMVGVEESAQQREGTPGPLDQGGLGGCADLRVAGQQAIRPVTCQGGVSGKTSVRRKRRLRGRRGGAGSQQEESYDE